MPAIEFEIFCNTCNASLTCFVYGMDVFVEPCADCIEAAKEQGGNEVYDDAYNEGYSDGRIPRYCLPVSTLSPRVSGLLV